MSWSAADMVEAAHRAEMRREERRGDALEAAEQAKAEAAGELYEALKALYDETVDYIKINNLAGAENNQVLQQARAVLAKARGE